MRFSLSLHMVGRIVMERCMPRHVQAPLGGGRQPRSVTLSISCATNDIPSQGCLRGLKSVLNRDISWCPYEFDCYAHHVASPTRRILNDSVEEREGAFAPIRLKGHCTRRSRPQSTQLTCPRTSGVLHPQPRWCTNGLLEHRRL